MSTRCNIIIKDARYGDGRVILYHHCDGYPEGVGVQLRKVLACYNGEHFPTEGRAVYSIANRLVKDQTGLNDKEYEITTCVHSDIDFLYEITFDYEGSTLKCYEYWDEWIEEEEKYKTHKDPVKIPAWDGGATIYEKEAEL